MAVDWTHGYSCEWRVMRVDPSTWTDAGEVAGFDSATVTREDEGTLERASLSMTASAGDDFAEGWYRLLMLAVQDGGWQRVDVCTVWCNATDDAAERGMVVRDVTGRSVLWPASVRMMDVGAYAPAGTDGAAWVAARLAECTPAPIVCAASFTLGEHVVFDTGTSVLDAAWTVLAVGGCILMLDGSGRVTIAERPSAPALTLDSARARLLQPETKRTLDWGEVPNRYVAVQGTTTAQAINDDPNSPTSTVRRGFVIDAERTPDTSPVLVGGETLDSYCTRRLAELSTVADERTYKREWWPNVVPGSLVRGSLASVGLEGDMRVTAQQLKCGRGVVVEETAEREVSLWPMT